MFAVFADWMPEIAYIPTGPESLLILTRSRDLTLKSFKFLEEIFKILHFPLHFIHKMDETAISLLTGNPNTDDNFAAMFCSFLLAVTEDRRIN